MTALNTLKNISRLAQQRIRRGRGPGSGKGKTSGRGMKGAGARSGYKRPYGKEGGQFPLYMKLPIRGFSNARFCRNLDTVNLWQIEALYNDGDVVNAETLKQHGFISGKSFGVKVLAEGELKKKVSIEAHAISAGAREKLETAKIPFTIVTKS